MNVRACQTEIKKECKKFAFNKIRKMKQHFIVIFPNKPRMHLDDCFIKYHTKQHEYRV